MDSLTPPPLPTRENLWRKRVLILLICVGTIIGLVVVGIVVLRGTKLIEPFSVPTGSMSPTINRGDQIFVERLTYLVGKPRRGDVVVFQTDGIASLPVHELYVKRLVGMPGDVLSNAKGLLFVNGQPAVFNGKTVTLPKFPLPGTRYLADDWNDVTVPVDHYFVLGDNAINSLDSRHFGCIPTRSVVSRAVLCYLPTNRMEWIH